MKKIVSLALAMIMIMTMTACKGGKSNKRTDIPPEGTFVKGITVDSEGDLLLDGEKLYAYGVNIYDIFVNKRRLNANYDVETPLKTLRDSGISIARMSIGPYTVGHFANYYYSPDEYFEALDAVIAACEKYHIGIFASISWNPVIKDFVGETWDQMGDPNSKTVQVAKQYYTDVVKRYKDSPAIWAWEFGNEYNLYADLFYVQPADHVRSEDTSVYYQEVGKAIRKIDPYRLIVGGDSELGCRPASLRKTNSWKADDLQDTIESTELYAPSPLEAISSHMYEYGQSGKTVEETTFKDYKAAVQLALDACHELKKGYYIGEYGPGSFLNDGTGTIETNKHVLDLMHQAFIDLDVQVALGWICTTDFSDKKSLRSEPYIYWYSELERINKEFKEAGKQDNIASYWEKADNAIYKGDDSVFTKVTNYMGVGTDPGTAVDVVDNKAVGDGWAISDYDTKAIITLVDEKLADGSTGKVFRIVNSTAESKVMIRYQQVYGLERNGKFKMSFYMKMKNVSGDGVRVALSSPEFGVQEGLKCDKDNEWQLFEFEIDGPSIGKPQNSFSLFFQGQTGEVMFYGVTLTKIS